MYLIFIYDELFCFKEDIVEIEDVVINSDMIEGEGNDMFGDILIKGVYLNMCIMYM